MKIRLATVALLLALAACDNMPQNAAPIIGNSLKGWCEFQPNCAVADPDHASNVIAH